MSTPSEWKLTKTVNPNFKCRKCGSDDVKYRIVEDSDCHEDVEYVCNTCNRTWWVEGSDY